MQEFNTFSQPLFVFMYFDHRKRSAITCIQVTRPRQAFICYMNTSHPTTASVHLLHVYKSPDHGKHSSVKMLVYKPFRPSGGGGLFEPDLKRIAYQLAQPYG